MAHTRIRLGQSTEALREDHRRILALLGEFQALPSDAHDRRRETFEQVRQLLLLHFVLEEEVLFPALHRTGVERALECIQEARWGQRLIRQLLAEMDETGPRHPAFAGQMRILRANVKHAVETEERSLFAEVRALSRETNQRLQSQLEERREQLLRRPQ